MEFLRRKIILLILTAAGFSAVAQVSQEALEAAFNKSYQLEKAGDFSAAADVLKKVFDESSYELNLRLGWLNYNAGLFDESVIFYSNAQKAKTVFRRSPFWVDFAQSRAGPVE
jgi:hypothetical protein